MATDAQSVRPDLTGNPFAEPSTLPFGLPPFDLIRPEHYLPAFTAGMAEHLAQVRAVAQNPEPPSFANTLEALERSGELLRRASSTFYNIVISDSSDELRAIEEELAPLLAAHWDAVLLDPELFARVDALHRRRAELTLTDEQAYLLERYHRDFVRSGAGLDAAQQARLRQINERLSVLEARFNAASLAEAADSAVLVEDRARLAGLSQGRMASARDAASARGLDGYLLSLVLPTPQPVLEHLTDRTLREQVHTASVSRGSRGNEHDVRELVVEVVRLRAERAALLGFASHAAYVAADETAQDTAAVNAMLDLLAGPAVRNARAEAEELAQMLDGGRLEPWDWAFCAEKVRVSRFEVDTEALSAYFELERVVRDGVFFAAERLYGVSFRRRTDLPVYHPDVQVYDVLGEDGSPMALFLADWFARDSKKGGAWMSSFVSQSHLLSRRPVIVINLNVPKPAQGQPALMTLDEVTTAFHEFGHVLHGLFSDVVHPRFSGTSVPRDFVEFPSQVNEMWAFHPQVLPNYARHHETGEPLPPRDVERVQAAERYGQGFATTEYLAAALLDQEWHRLTVEEAAALSAGDVLGFEAQALARRGVDLPLVPPRYRSTYFAHIFGGGYAAAYYAYIWSEVLDADTVDWFTENGGLTRENGERFRREILAPGGSRDPLASFRALRGRDAEVGPLLRRRGLDQ